MRKILFFVLLSSLTFGQNKEIDSLRNILFKDKRNLTSYTDVINYFTGVFDLDSVGKYSNEFYKNAKVSSNKDGYAESILYLSNYYNLRRDYVKRDFYLKECIQQSQKLKNKRVWASAHFMLARDNYNKSQSKECIGNSLKALSYYEKMGIKGAVMIEPMYSMLVLSYINTGQLILANNYLIKHKKIVKEAGIKYADKRVAQGEIAILEAKNENERALKVRLNLINKLKKYDHEYNRTSLLAEEYFNIASKFSERNNTGIAKKYLDSSKLIAQKADKSIYEKIKPYYTSLETELLLKDDKINNKILDSIEKKTKSVTQENFNIAKIHTLKADFYKSKKDYKKSIEEYEITKDHFLKEHFRKEYGNSLKQLIELNILVEDSVKAIDYLKDYSHNNELYFNEQVAKSLSLADVKYGTELKEAQIKSQQLELEKEKTNRNVAISGIGFLLLLSGGGFWFFKNRQKQKELQNQNTLLGLQQNLNAMELQSLNKQLDPHEIKNLLASISPEIQEKAPESYRKMLKLFNITKASLNTNSLTDSIENQTQQIEDFLSLEKSMLTVPFEYFIKNTVENKDLQIPRLMLKNLVENAIKHGIKGTESGGKVEVSLFEKNNFITITVDDTGKGRQQAILSDSGIGTSTYQKLFATLNQKNRENATFEIIDKEQGTKVEVKIPVDYKYN